MNLHQILICDPGTDLSVSDQIQTNINSVKQYFSNTEYHLYTLDELIEFISKNFDKEVAWAFNSLEPYAFKADLARYCLLYVLGGVYVDLRVRMINSFDLDDFDFFFFRDLPNNTNKWNNYAIQNGFIYSKEKNDVFVKCIDAIVENCKNKFYGFTPLDVTGPVLLGKYVAEENFYTNNKKGEFGTFQYLTPERENKNLGYITCDGDIIALKTDNLQITEHVQNTNIYDKMWYDTLVYR